MIVRHRGSIGCLAVGSAGGAVGLAVVAGALEPRWAAQPPQAALDPASGAITRTRLQASRESAGGPRLLLLDTVQLQVIAGVWDLPVRQLPTRRVLFDA